MHQWRHPRHSPAGHPAASTRRPLRGNFSRSWPRRPAESRNTAGPRRENTHTRGHAHARARARMHDRACIRAYPRAPPLPLEALGMGYFLIRTHLIQFLPIPQSSIAKLCSTGVQQLAMASNLFGGSGMHGKLYTIHQILSSTVAILAQGTSWADAATQASIFVRGGSIPGTHNWCSDCLLSMHKILPCGIWEYSYSCSPLGPW